MRVKTLLIVYKEKDEKFFEQLKDLLEAKDDDLNEIIGVQDGSVRPFKCSEKQWLEHKSKGRIEKLADKVLFIDDLADITLPHPVFNKYGISYGPIDNNSYAIIVDEKHNWDEETYAEFQSELKAVTDDEKITEIDAFEGKKNTKTKLKKGRKAAFLGLLLPGVLFVAGGMLAKGASDAKKIDEILRSQMLYYAITKVYLEELDNFMKE